MSITNYLLCRWAVQASQTPTISIMALILISEDWIWFPKVISNYLWINNIREIVKSFKANIISFIIWQTNNYWIKPSSSQYSYLHNSSQCNSRSFKIIISKIFKTQFLAISRNISEVISKYCCNPLNSSNNNSSRC